METLIKTCKKFIDCFESEYKFCNPSDRQLAYDLHLLKEAFERIFKKVKSKGLYISEGRIIAIDRILDGLFYQIESSVLVSEYEPEQLRTNLRLIETDLLSQLQE